MSYAKGPGLKEIIRAQVAFLFSRFKPVGGLTEDEQKAVGAERVEFTERVFAYLNGVTAAVPEIIEQVRFAARHFQEDQRLSKMPTPEEVAGRVKAHFSAKATSAPCRGCKDMSGYYSFNGTDAPLLHRQDGIHRYPGSVFLCGWHHDAAFYFVARERRRQEGRPYTYEPPSVLVPRLYFCSQGEREDVTAYLYGGKMGPMARWAHAFAKEVYGLEIEQAQLFAPDVAAQPDPFQDV